MYNIYHKLLNEDVFNDSIKLIAYIFDKYHITQEYAEYIYNNGTPTKNLKKLYSFDDTIYFSCYDMNDVYELDEILCQNKFTSLKIIEIEAPIITDCFCDFVIRKNNVIELFIRIDYDTKMILTKKIIDMFLCRKFNRIEIPDFELFLNPPILKKILKNKHKFIISDDVMSYIKDLLYEYHDISFFQLSNNIKRLANDFAQEKIE